MNRRLVDEDDLSDQRLYTDEEIHAFYGQLVERLKAEGVYREGQNNGWWKNMPGFMIVSADQAIQLSMMETIWLIESSCLLLCIALM